MTDPIQEITRPRENASTSPDPADVALLAYQLWSDRGCPVGSPEEDWFRAEEELRVRTNGAAA
jgi:hypothetical protein